MMMMIRRRRVTSNIWYIYIYRRKEERRCLVWSDGRGGWRRDGKGRAFFLNEGKEGLKSLERIRQIRNSCAYIFVHVVMCERKD